MDFGALLSRAWDIVWNHKWLIILGFLVMLGGSGVGGGGGGGGGSGFSPPSTSGDFQFEEPGQGGEFDFDEEFSEEDFEEFFQTAFPFLAVGGGLLIVVICIAIVIGLALWVIAQIATGGLIYGVNEIEEGRESSFGESWGAAWEKALRLLGIGIIPSIPGWIMLFGFLIAGGALFATLAGTGSPEELLASVGIGLAVTLVCVICIVALLSLVLEILATFAFRAAMLEDLTIFDAYRRGWDVLTANLGPAIILFLIQLAIGIVLGILLLGPSLFALLCCILIPVLWLVNATVTTFFSTVWTLAWREWTGNQPAVSGPEADVATPV